MPTYKVIAVWVGIGLGLGILGAVETFITSEGNMRLSLTMVGLGLILGLVTGLLYSLVHRDRS
jgi:VIT1/CCC1 family predicted Fe2+/Mn2+ transporter